MLPNFLLIGAQRSGTTFLYTGLKQHPEIYMSPVKEPCFFSTPQTADRMEDYRALFAGVTTEKLVGEASPVYLHSPEAPARIAQLLPEVKLVAILRNPVERAYSHFLQHVRFGDQDLDFAAALAAEGQYMRDGRSPVFYYRDIGFYSRQLERYLAVFDRAQMQILLYDDLQTDPDGVFRSVFRFLGVDARFAVDVSVRRNPSGVPKSGRLHRLVTGPSLAKRLLKMVLPEDLQELLILRVSNVNLSKPPLDPQIRQQLAREYRQDILKTQALIGRDLSSWLEA